MNTAANVGSLFFPQSKSLGIDRSNYSPGVQQKIVYAGANSKSFAQASDSLRVLAELAVPVKQVQRQTRQIGEERVAERNEAVQAFKDLPLVDKHATPAAVVAPQVAAIMVDGGRLQLRDAEPEEQTSEVAAGDTVAPATAEPEKERGKHWREDRIGLLMVLESEQHATDPCPQIPEHFVEASKIVKLARELKPVPLEEDNVESAAQATAVDPEATAEPPSYEPPEVVQRRVVASRHDWHEFGPHVAQAARDMGLLGAIRKAFVGDGSENNWTLQRRFFGSFVPILDFIHGLSYVFAAALAGRNFDDGWPIYVRWITWVWQGEVERVIAELAQRQVELGTPASDDSATSPRRLVARSLTYLQNHKDKMRYADYRRQGLPLTSSHVESLIKEINYRVKGTEKFWCEAGAEALLQLRADLLSDDRPLDAFWQRRQASETGQRRYSMAA